MRSAKETLDTTYLEMRWRILSLAADFDRIERADGGGQVLRDDPRVAELRQALRLALDATDATRAERVQMLLSDHTPPPTR
jgi:hypothetical protein